MAIEIERKFLVVGDTWRIGAQAKTLKQGYLASSKDGATVRARSAGDAAWLTVKGPASGISRSEFEYPIPTADADAMLSELSDGGLIEKTRYSLVVGDLEWVIDEFAGDNRGLIVAEIELDDETQEFERPDWLGAEVSDDPRYFNSNLRIHPYNAWDTGKRPTAAAAAAFDIAGYRPGAIGWVSGLHGRYYHEHWGFDLSFESKIATGLSMFLTTLDPGRDRFWLAGAENRMVGSVSIDGSDAEAQGAHLRWFIVDPDSAGQGLGRTLLDSAVRFCRERNYRQIYLWTFSGLDAARHLYESRGFQLDRELRNDQWGKEVMEQRFVLRLR